MNQISNQRVDASAGICPAFRNRAQGNTLTDASLLADYSSNALELATHSFVDCNNFVEGIGHFAGQTGPVRWQTVRKVSTLECDQCVEQLFQLDLVVAIKTRTICRM